MNKLAKIKAVREAIASFKSVLSFDGDAEGMDFAKQVERKLKSKYRDLSIELEPDDDGIGQIILHIENKNAEYLFDANISVAIDTFDGTVELDITQGRRTRHVSVSSPTPDKVVRAVETHAKKNGII